ncbi:MAG: L,D-transpeptidase [Patescibacteria group bacterium]
MSFWRNFLIATNVFLVSVLLLSANWQGWLSPDQRIDLNQLTEKFDQQATMAVFNNQLVKIPSFREDQSRVLGESSGNKRIEVDLTNQRLYAYEDNRQIYNFSISSGKWGKTPTGVFKIWIKLRYTKMEGGSKSLRTYYYLPNVPYVMFFYNEKIPKQRGFGIHGTYWHDNFGQPMSHGCINMKTEEAGLIYQWAESGQTPIVIYGQAPN